MTLIPYQKEVNLQDRLARDTTIPEMKTMMPSAKEAYRMMSIWFESAYRPGFFKAVGYSKLTIQNMVVRGWIPHGFTTLKVPFVFWSEPKKIDFHTFEESATLLEYSMMNRGVVLLIVHSDEVNKIAKFSCDFFNVIYSYQAGDCFMLWGTKKQSQYETLFFER